MPQVAPGQSSHIPLPEVVSRCKSSQEIYLTISVTLRHDTSWSGAGHEVAWSQHQIQTSTSSLEPTFPMNKLRSTIQVTFSGSSAELSGKDFKFVFDRARGSLKSWVSHGLELLTSDPETGAAIYPSFWRPATDNDVPGSLPYWQRFGLDQLTSQHRSMKFITSVPDCVIVKAHTYITPPVLAWGWECEIDYVVSRFGTLRINVTRLSPTGSIPDHIPRIGLNLCLNKSLNQAKWFGLGPGESYPDKKSSQRIGIWSVESVADLQTPYDVPQENGNRMDTRWVKLSSSQVHPWGIRARRIGEPATFSFVATHHSAKTIQAAKHPPDLVEEDATLLRLDVEVAGVGTGACGPGVREDLMVRCKEMSFGFELESL